METSSLIPSDPNLLNMSFEDYMKDLSFPTALLTEVPTPPTTSSPTTPSSFLPGSQELEFDFSFLYLPTLSSPTALSTALSTAVPTAVPTPATSPPANANAPLPLPSSPIDDNMESDDMTSIPAAQVSGAQTTAPLMESDDETPEWVPYATMEAEANSDDEENNALLEAILPNYTAPIDADMESDDETTAATEANSDDEENIALLEAILPNYTARTRGPRTTDRAENSAERERAGNAAERESAGNSAERESSQSTRIFREATKNFRPPEDLEEIILRPKFRKTLGKNNQVWKGYQHRGGAHYAIIAGGWKDSPTSKKGNPRQDLRLGAKDIFPRKNLLDNKAKWETSTNPIAASLWKNFILPTVNAVKYPGYLREDLQRAEVDGNLLRLLLPDFLVILLSKNEFKNDE